MERRREGMGEREVEKENVSKKERRRWLGGEGEEITSLAEQETCEKGRLPQPSTKDIWK